jgi:protein arginine kinase activator
MGKFGCPNDYVTFKKGLLGLFDRIHGSTQHRGKVPSRTTDRIAQQKELMQLREELKNAVAAEAYERAVELRDKVHKLEAELGGDSVADDRGEQES